MGKRFLFGVVCVLVVLNLGLIVTMIMIAPLPQSTEREDTPEHTPERYSNTTRRHQSKRWKKMIRHVQKEQAHHIDIMKKLEKKVKRMDDRTMPAVAHLFLNKAKTLKNSDGTLVWRSSLKLDNRNVIFGGINSDDNGIFSVTRAGEYLSMGHICFDTYKNDIVNSTFIEIVFKASSSVLSPDKEFNNDEVLADKVLLESKSYLSTSFMSLRKFKENERFRFKFLKSVYAEYIHADESECSSLTILKVG
ncbi:uncharacterized protein LOC124144759 [Haliotis rufescens]|uniref:uncharacterized protein LOC124144759 n=1 Tax=Haliotis rufescens TaxID=6454 RepID=UPI00201F3885|nr:uncharacterized protein LOC124144759 [Haliotis rufescens]